MNSPSISVVVPVFNSQDTLVDLVQRLTRTLENLCSNYEIILVNDGSIDHSWQVIEKLGQDDQNIRGLDLMRNYGQHNALLAGLRAAHYEITVTLDDDLQNPPEEIYKLLQELEKGFDVVYGSPLKQAQSPWRNFGSWITRIALQSAMGVKHARNVSAFRAMRTHLRDAFDGYRSPYVILDVLLTWGTDRFSVVTVGHAPRQIGRSNYNLKRLIFHAVNMITGFTILPLQIASFLGFAFAVFGIIILFYVIGRFLIQGGSVPGFPFLASIIAIFSGVQLFALGIIGEYLARMHYRLMERPPYIIRKKTKPTSEKL